VRISVVIGFLLLVIPAQENPGGRAGHRQRGDPSRTGAFFARPISFAKADFRDISGFSLPASPSQPATEKGIPGKGASAPRTHRIVTSPD